MELSVVGKSQCLLFPRDSAVFGDQRKVYRFKNLSFLQRCNCPLSGLKSAVKASQRAVAPIPSTEDGNRADSVGRSFSGIEFQLIPLYLQNEWVRLFVGLPLDTVSDSETLNHSKAIAAGLKALKLLGVEGVELPVWWGVCEKTAMGEYNWTGYLEVAEMVRTAGLKLHVSLCFHGSDSPRINLPDWVSKIGESQPDIFFADRSGKRYKNCLSLAADELPLLNGKTPLQIYRDFCDNFCSSFSSFMSTTITGITIGLGPNGDLRYPSHQQSRKGETGSGEFQCYDENILALLKSHAEAAEKPLWGLGGPHDAPAYDQSPKTTKFFNDDNGSWESDYGRFFLSWYASELTAHGDRLLSMASSAFKSSGLPVYGRVPLMHQWFDTRSHASELTAGFFNTESTNGYDSIAEVFARNSCKMIVQGMDVSSGGPASNPEKLVKQMMGSCRKHGVEIAGQNAYMSNDGLEKIKGNMADMKVNGVFIYERMGAEFFSPDHFPAFTQFVRSLKQPEVHADDRPQKEGVVSSMIRPSSEAEMQVA